MSPWARRKPRFTASYIPESFSMNALTRVSCGSQFFVSSSEHESWTMCSKDTPDWSAMDAMQSFSHAELRKLGVMMLNFMSSEPAPRRTAAQFDRHYETLRQGRKDNYPPRNFSRNGRGAPRHPRTARQ